MLPANSDASQAMAVARSHYTDLLESGVRIFESTESPAFQDVTIDECGRPSDRRTSITAACCSMTRSTPSWGTHTARVWKSVSKRTEVAKEINLEIWRERPLHHRSATSLADDNRCFRKTVDAPAGAIDASLTEGPDLMRPLAIVGLVLIGLGLPIGARQSPTQRRRR